MVSSAGGGGLSSAFFAAEPVEVVAAGETLENRSGVVAGARGYGPLDGVGEAEVVEAAAAAFRTAWEMPLHTWQADLSSLGQAVIQSGRAIALEDANAASVWASMAAGAR